MSGTLYCLKCKQSVTGKDFDEADSIMNHAATSTRCSGSPGYLQWTEASVNKNTVAPKQTVKPLTRQSKK